MTDMTHANPELFAAMARDSIDAMAKTGESYWMAHADYPGYLATIDGRVYSARKRRMMKPIQLGKYVGLQVIHREHGPVKRYLHRLLLEMWTGVVPHGMQACHNNGDRYDNRISNLRWDTPAANHADKVAHGTSGHGEQNPMAKLTRHKVSIIRNRVANGETQRSLCAEYGVSPMTISRAVRGETWSH